MRLSTRVYPCDNCGTVEPVRTMYYVALGKIVSNNRKDQLFLCPKCASDFDEFLNILKRKE